MHGLKNHFLRRVSNFLCFMNLAKNIKNYFFGQKLFFRPKIIFPTKKIFFRLKKYFFCKNGFFGQKTFSAFFFTPRLENSKNKKFETRLKKHDFLNPKIFEMLLTPCGQILKLIFHCFRKYVISFIWWFFTQSSPRSKKSVFHNI